MSIPGTQSETISGGRWSNRLVLTVVAAVIVQFAGCRQYHTATSIFDPKEALDPSDLLSRSYTGTAGDSLKIDISVGSEVLSGNEVVLEVAISEVGKDKLAIAALFGARLFSLDGEYSLVELRLLVMKPAEFPSGGIPSYKEGERSYLAIRKDFSPAEVFLLGGVDASAFARVAAANGLRVGEGDQIEGDVTPAGLRTLFREAAKLAGSKQRLVMEFDPIRAWPAELRDQYFEGLFAGISLSPALRASTSVGPITRYLELAHEAGAGWASYALSRFMIYGLGVPQDYPQTKKLAETAVRRGVTQAHATLGFIALRGLVGEPDLAVALDHFQRASAAGSAVAMANLAFMHQQGTGVEKDPGEALRWAEKATDRRMAAAEWMLGNWYLNGEGVEKDESRAWEYFERAGQQHFAPAVTSMAVMLENQEDPPAAPEQIARMYRYAADLGDATAQLKYGGMLRDGIGVEKDEEAGAEYSAKAKAEGKPMEHLDSAEPKLYAATPKNEKKLQADALKGLAQDRNETIQEAVEGYTLKKQRLTDLGNNSSRKLKIEFAVEAFLIAKVLRKNQKFEEAESFYSEATDVLSDQSLTKDEYAVEWLSKIYPELASVRESQGNFKAAYEARCKAVDTADLLLSMRPSSSSGLRLAEAFMHRGFLLWRMGDEAAVDKELEVAKFFAEKYLEITPANNEDQEYSRAVMVHTRCVLKKSIGQPYLWSDQDAWSPADLDDYSVDGELERDSRRTSLYSKKISAPFYEKGILIRTSPLVSSEDAESWQLVIDGKVVASLGDSIEQILQINKAGNLNLNESNVIDYLKFFCYFTRKDSSPFMIVEYDDSEGTADYFNLDRGPWLFRVLDAEWEAWKGMLYNPVFVGRAANGAFLVDACVAFKTDLYSARFIIEKTGSVTMDNETVIARGDSTMIRKPLPIKPEIAGFSIDSEEAE